MQNQNRNKVWIFEFLFRVFLVLVSFTLSESFNGFLNEAKKQRSKEANYWTVNIGLKSCDWRKDAFDFSRKWLFIVYNFAETCNLLQYRSPIRVTPHQEGNGSLVPVLR